MQILNFLIRLSYSDLNNERLSEIHTYTNSGNVIYPVDMSTIGVNMGIALNL